MEAKVVLQKELEEEKPPPKIDLELLVRNLLENPSALDQVGDAEVLAADS